MDACSQCGNRAAYWIELPPGEQPHDRPFCETCGGLLLDKLIADLRNRLHIAYDAAPQRITHNESAPGHALFIDNFNEPSAWMRIQIEDSQLASSAWISANIRYHKTVTGVDRVPHWATDLAWEMAHEALASGTAKLPQTHQAPPLSRITSRIAGVLAARERIQAWGGFLDDDRTASASHLTAEEREVLRLRENGEVVL